LSDWPLRDVDDRDATEAEAEAEAERGAVGVVYFAATETACLARLFGFWTWDCGLPSKALGLWAVSTGGAAVPLRYF
jgi:hypothetical protein